MSFRSIQQQVNDLFDRTDHANIAHKDDNDYKKLLDIRKLPISPKQSIDIIKDVLEAIIYVSSHLIIYKPCQVFKEHVIEKHGRWGLCNIVCYRDPNENQEFDPDRYYPMDYYEHPDEDSELAWSLGRMWFQLLTDTRIPPIRAINEQDLDTIIATSGISDLRIVSLLKQILVIDKNKRLDLHTLIKHGLFQYEERSRMYLHSVIPNLSKVQDMSKLINLNNNKFESRIQKVNYNPYEEQLFKRDFKEAIVIAQLFEKVKKFIFNSFEMQENNDEIDFSCYLMDVVSYIRLNGFRLRRQQNQYLIVLLYDKLDYTHFLEKLLELQAKIQRKRKMKKFNDFRSKLPKLLQSPQRLTKEEVQTVYLHFKTYLMTFAKHYQEQRMLKKQGMDAKSYVCLIQIMLVRTSNYVFSNCRKHVFGEFMNSNQTFNLKTVLKNIAECENIEKLKKLQKTIFDLYFPSNNSRVQINNREIN